MELAAALATYDRVALNLDKLDRVWQRMVQLVPGGPFLGTGSPDEVEYAALAERWAALAASLPAIRGHVLRAAVIDYAAIGQARLDYLDLGEPLSGHNFEAQVHAPGTEAARYRQRLDRARQELVQKRAAQLVQTVDELLDDVPTGDDDELPAEEATPLLHAVGEAVTELERLIGAPLDGGPRRSDLHRHLHFAEPHDLRDIATMDWPAYRPHVELALYGDEDPVPIPVDDLADLGDITTSPVPAAIGWDRVDADGFERLLVRLLEKSGQYTRISRLMKINAPDGGRDIEAYLRVSDGLADERLERYIVQAKHWPARGIGPTEIADLVHAKLPLWEGEPVRGLIIATTGSFTQDAVRWIDAHNLAAKRPRLVPWSSSELDGFLRRWPAVIAEFGLIG
ncbi:restriction endonuclease [Cryptosporangium sp. NPDC051539]|uniref:restriction endonuclease n=1 Tax=Cryptosporangium sp. NPDC051539 TaxID=3363962 RepID=UPI00379D55DF